MEPIAIVGIGCRFPGDGKDDIDNPSGLWDFLQRKGDAYSDFPRDRINLDGWYHPESGRPGSFYTRGGCFLKQDPRDFDPSFFGISPQEARTLDPAQRKLLESVYEAFEASGTPLSKLRGSATGCFVGNFNFDHLLMHFRDAEFPESYAMTGGGITLLSNRISYVFDLQGPSLTLDTACSSSMYALHLACSAIQSGECSAAVVAGSNLILTPECQIFSASLGAVSKSSKCNTFDAAADGYARAEGVAVLYIKKLSQAVQDCDPIRAVIRSTAINANGRTAGITHPSPNGQERAIRRAYERAGDLNPALTSYFECHGTGTPVGDPLEVEAVGRVFAADRSADSPLLIGSIKTNMGHCEAASGIAGIIKAVLAIENGIIPPIRALSLVNPNVDLKNGSLKIVQDSTPWPEGAIRRASVNSFGYGGANAHTIVEDVDILVPGYRAARARSIRPSAHALLPTADISNGVSTPLKSPTSHSKAQNADGRWFLLPFSAHSESTLKRNIAKLVPQTSQWSISDLAFTLGCRRTTFGVRSFVVSTREQAETNAMDTVDLDVQRVRVSQTTRLAFVFTGQGAQWPGMGKELMETFHVYLDSIRGLDEVLCQLMAPPKWTIEDILRAPPETSRVYEAPLSQPLVTAVQIALVDLFKSWGITPVASVGHSSGEIAAAYSAGRLSAAEAIIIAYARGRAIACNKSDGRMLAVGLGGEDVERLIEPYPSVTIACYNSPESTTLSGDRDAILALKDSLKARNILAKVLETGNNAYHSAHMKVVGAAYEMELEEMLESIHPKQRIPSRMTSTFVSSVTNSHYHQHPIECAYWRKNLESPVLFVQAVATLVRSTEIDFALELGPHTALKGPINQIAHSLEDVETIPEYIATLIRGEDGAKCVLNTAGALWSRGLALDFESISSSYLPENYATKSYPARAIADLPKYQWDHTERYYFENRWTREWRLKTHLHHDILGSRQHGGNHNAPMWRNILKLKHVPWLRDHKIGRDIVFPAAGYILMAVEAATQMAEGSGTARSSIARCDCEDLEIVAPLTLTDDTDGVEVLLNLHRARLNKRSYHASRYEFTITSVTHSNNTDSFTEHASGVIHVVSQADQLQLASNVPILGTNTKPVAEQRWYDTFEQVGLNYGPAFRCLSKIASSGSERNVRCSLLTDTTKDMMPGQSNYAVHPATLDAALQLAIISGHNGRFTECDSAFIPTSIAKLSIAINTSFESTAPAVAQSSYVKSRNLISSVMVTGADGQPAITIDGLELARIGSLVAPTPQPKPHPFTRFMWKPDLDLLSVTGTEKLYVSPYESKKAKVPDEAPLELLSLMLIVQFYKEYPEIFACGSDSPDLQRFLSWMIDKVHLAEQGGIRGAAAILNQTIEERRNAIQALSASISDAHGPEMRLLCHLFDSYPRVFAGEISGIEAAVQENRLNDLYEYMHLYKGGSLALASLVELFSHKKPGLKIFEIGGGTGSATREVLRVLRGDTDFRGYESYMFTDIAPSFLTTTGDAIKQYNGVDFAVCDIEKPVTKQGFAEGDHDLVIASNVIHATSDLQNAMLNARSLLKPGGKLVLFEVTVPGLMLVALLGTFSGFWKGDHDLTFPRLEGPFMTVPEWHDILCRTGFSGSDVALDHFAEYNNAAVIISTAIEPASSIPAQISPQPLTVVYRDTPSSFVVDFQTFAQATGYLVDLVPIHSASMLASKRVICLAEIDRPFFTTCSEDEWHGAKAVFLDAESSLWVTRGDLLNAGGDPEFAMVGGIVATIHAENTSSRALCFDLSASENIPQQEQFSQIFQLEKKALEYTPNADFDFRSQWGIINISRLLDVAELNGLATRRKSKAMFDLTSPVSPMKSRKQSRAGLNLVSPLSPTKPNGVFNALWPSPLEGAGQVANFKPALSIQLPTSPTDHRSSLQSLASPVDHRGSLQSLASPVDRRGSVQFLVSPIGRRGSVQPLASTIGRRGSVQPLASPVDRRGSIQPLTSPVDRRGSVMSIKSRRTSMKLRIPTSQDHGPLFRPDASYLLIGCLGGLGRSFATWAVSRGAKHLVFLSRSGASSPPAAAMVAELEAAGVDIQVVRGDVTSAADVETAVASARMPIRGVVHGPLVLRDMFLDAMSLDDFNTTMRPRVMGTLNLHHATQAMDLDFFMLWSSMTKVLGSASQSSYVASNAFMDAFAVKRQGLGLPATSLALGQILDVGTVSENLAFQENLMRMGLYGNTEREFLQFCQAAISPIYTAAQTPQGHSLGRGDLVVGLEPAGLLKNAARYPLQLMHWYADPRFAHLLQATRHAAKETQLLDLSDAGVDGDLEDLSPGSILERVLQTVAQFLYVPVESLDATKPLNNYGMDSLVAAQVRTWLLTTFNANVSLLNLLSPTTTVETLAAEVEASLIEDASSDEDLVGEASGDEDYA